MAKSALTTAQRIRMKAEAAANGAKNNENRAKRTVESAQQAVRATQAQGTPATKPVRAVKQAGDGSKKPKPAEQRPAHVVTEPDSSSDRVITPPWEVEDDEPVVGDARYDAGLGGVEEPPPGSRTFDPLDEADPYALQKTTTPGVYINRAGILVDANGIALNFKQVKDKDDARWEQILGKPVETPAELLKAVSLDPTKPLAMRIDAAKSAAPYTDRKKPIGIDGGEDGKPIMMSIKELRGLDGAELLAMEALVAKALAAPENAE
jgi:hypothetical protein